MTIQEKLMQAAIDKAVSEKLGVLLQELNAFTKDMLPIEGTAARLMLLAMMRNSSETFYAKVQTRISSERV